MAKLFELFFDRLTYIIILVIIVALIKFCCGLIPDEDDDIDDETENQTSNNDQIELPSAPFLDEYGRFVCPR